MVYRTGAGVPSGNFTSRVELTQTTSVSLSWTTPSSPNGIIQRYLVRSFDQLSNSSVTRYDGLALGTQVSGLTPYSRYLFTVSACSSVGCLDTSVTAVTLQAPPDGQRPPTVITDGPTTLNVSWQPPTQPNGTTDSQMFVLFAM